MDAPAVGKYYLFPSEPEFSICYRNGFTGEDSYIGQFTSQIASGYLAGQQFMDFTMTIYFITGDLLEILKNSDMKQMVVIISMNPDVLFNKILKVLYDISTVV